MTREEAIKHIKDIICENNTVKHSDMVVFENEKEALRMAIKALSQEPCEKCVYSTKDGYCQYDDISETIPPLEQCDDAISREAVDKYIARLLSGYLYDGERERLEIFSAYLWELPSVTHKSGKCKNCKYFEYDSVAKVDGVPLIVAHEICNKWGDGCKTSEDGYCYLFEPQESEE